MKESSELAPETLIWNHNFVPTGSISKPIVFSDPGNQVVETKKIETGCINTVLTNIKNYSKINLSKG